MRPVADRPGQSSPSPPDLVHGFLGKFCETPNQMIVCFVKELQRLGHASASGASANGESEEQNRLSAPRLLRWIHLHVKTYGGVPYARDQESERHAGLLRLT